MADIEVQRIPRGWCVEVDHLTVSPKAHTSTGGLSGLP